VIVHHGYEKVEVKSSNGASGTMSFILSVGSDLAPVLQILAYCVLPSKNVVASSKNFIIEKCFKNKVCIMALEISLPLLYFTLLSVLYNTFTVYTGET